MEEKRIQQENMELKRKIAEANLMFKNSEKKAKNYAYQTPHHYTFSHPPPSSGYTTTSRYFTAA